jgi:AraC-like DNA-binding protein
MGMNVYMPSPALAPFIKNYRIVESECGVVNRVLPDTSMVMAFRFRGRVSYVTDERKALLPAMTISGLRRSGRLIDYSSQAGNVLVVFKECGAQAFLTEPLHELFEESVALDALRGYQDLAWIEDVLGCSHSHEDRIAYMEQFLLSRLRLIKPDLLVAAAIGDIRKAQGTLRMKVLADRLCISQDAFEKRFRRVAGVSPKVFSSIVRMKSILHRGLNEMRLADAAFDAGYFDQPHFNKDFKLFTGQTPRDFLKSPVYW